MAVYKNCLYHLVVKEFSEYNKYSAIKRYIVRIPHVKNVLQFKKLCLYFSNLYNDSYVYMDLENKSAHATFNFHRKP